MQNLNKISTVQLYRFWKNFALSLFFTIAVFTLTKIFPAMLSPIWAFVCAGILYNRIMQSRRGFSNCVLVPYSTLVAMIVYAFTTIIVNVVYTWGMVDVPGEFLFNYGRAFIPSLFYVPIAFVTFFVILVAHKRMRVCKSCQLANLGSENPLTRSFLNTESRYQMKNLVLLFGVLTAIIWTYYLVFYVEININSRDWYVFTWLTIIVFMLDIIFFLVRYYNLYLDLQEQGEVLTPEQLSDMSARTYLRFYVVCQNRMYCDVHAIDPAAPYQEVIDTPFFTKRNVNGISIAEVRQIIEKMTGVAGGELRFFYGRKTDDTQRHNLLRYFYFIDGEPEENPQLRTPGEWIDFDRFKLIYTNTPGRLARLSVVDTTRLATILITSKTYDRTGKRKNKIKHYQPSFDLLDVRNSEIDFQNDDWIRISMFNSDVPFYRLRKWWRGILGRRI